MIDVLPYANRLKESLSENKLTICMSVRIVTSCEIALLARGAGFDALYVDMEHGSVPSHAAAQICVTAIAAGITPLIRVADHNGEEGARFLERGAQGLIVPHVSSAAEIAKYVRACSFPPKGPRSLGGAGPHFAYRNIGAGRMMDSLQRQMTVIAMLEDQESVGQADEIASVDGVDVLMIGSNDFLSDVGDPGNYDNPKLRQAYRSVAAACDKNRKTLGIAGIKTDFSLLSELVGLGARFLTGGSDSAILAQGLARQSETIRKISI